MGFIRAKLVTTAYGTKKILKRISIGLAMAAGLTSVKTETKEFYSI